MDKEKEYSTAGASDENVKKKGENLINIKGSVVGITIAGDKVGGKVHNIGDTKLGSFAIPSRRDTYKKEECSTFGSSDSYKYEAYFYEPKMIVSTKDGTEFDRFTIPPRLVTFPGREDEINKLDYLFFEKNKKKIAIYGPDGIGKSELAKQFIQKCLDANKIDRKFWIPCADEDELSNSSSLLKKMYRNCKNERCLFVFDDCLNRENICKYFPPDNDKYFLLVTSQEMIWEDDVASFELKPLSTEYAIEVLGFDEKLDIRNKRWYKELARILNNNPLALQIMARYLAEEFIRKHRNLVAHYVARIQDYKSEAKEINIIYRKSIYAVMQLSLNFIGYDNTIKVLYICSFLNPECIYFDDLLLICNVNSRSHFEFMILRMLKYFFIYYTCEEDRIIIHSLIQSLMRHHLRTCGQNFKREIYMSCLKYIFEEISGIKYNTSNIKSVLNYADENVEIVCEFFKSIHEKNRKKTENILENLIKYECYQCVQEIVKRFSDFINKYNLLHLAVKYDQTEILRVLLKNIDIDKADEQNATILHIAARDWKLKHIKIIFEFLPDVTIKNNLGNVPLFEFVNRPHFDTNIDWNDVLQMFKFDKDITNNKKQTLLHIAAAKYNDVLVKLLIYDYEMNVDEKDAENRTPFDMLEDTFSTPTFHNVEINKGMKTAEILLGLQ